MDFAMRFFKIANVGQLVENNKKKNPEYLIEPLLSLNWEEYL